MTLSDMSVVTAEVKVDETDIVSVKMGQDADVTIDAVLEKSQGKVTEIGSASGAANFGTGYHTVDREQPGSERLQSGGDDKRSPGTRASGPFKLREDQEPRREKRSSRADQRLR